MDELEISGKRYISTRRAAKEYGYHSDYIGQLIRGKKLLASKVGRSWYVELDSLAAYFGKEGGTIPKVGLVAKSVAEPKSVMVTPTQEEMASPGAPVEEPEEHEFREEVSAKVENNFQKEDSLRDSIHIPVRVRRPSFETPIAKKVMPLRYVSDDEPYMPTPRRISYGELSATMVMPRSVEEVEDMTDGYEEVHVVAKQEKNRIRLMPVISVAAMGIVALIVVMGGSVLLSSQTVVEAGKAASVGYTLQ